MHQPAARLRTRELLAAQAAVAAAAAAYAADPFSKAAWEALEAARAEYRYEAAAIARHEDLIDSLAGRRRGR